MYSLCVHVSLFSLLSVITQPKYLYSSTRKILIFGSLKNRGYSLFKSIFKECICNIHVTELLLES